MNKRIGLVVYPGFQVLDLAALTVFEFANTLQQEIVYEFAALSLEGGAIKSSTGVVIQSDAIGWGAYDTLMIAGATALPPALPELEAKLKEAASATRRIASICTGAFILAKTGLLDGKRATTHWHFGRHLQDQHPDVTVDEDKIFVKDGDIWSSAGVSACIDLSLALVEADLGVDVAKTIARLMVVYHRRTGGQSQFSALADLEPNSDRVKDALRFAKENLHKDLSVEDLAEHVHWSPRHFSRVFQMQTGMAPAKAIEKLRIEAAQTLIEQGHSSIGRIAAMAGFGDEERMRRAFLRTLGQPPKAFIHQVKSRNDNVYLN
ncbi:GlxA family transcriptional regulator [Oxalicibacterium faecigallinarum]|uniref:Transcriptional regulator n=1 Tax=Oxalicibacterium faecigallinarum TaxID=573741 RepID=A0A8J3AXX1_9BURK|nr:GlxA family transcriptional regulator [Oxalicibacterium faecigallinarum]GGI18333.1 transcriptional regulator [Oxalicibacterium faecigallinarum]